MTRVFTLSSFPYLFTLLVAIIGAQLNYLIESTISTPLIEYTLDEVGNSEDAISMEVGKKILNFSRVKYFGTISNITKKQSYKNVHLTIMFSEDQQAAFDLNELKRPTFKSIPPSALGNFDDQIQPQAIDYTIEHFQPGFEYQFSFDMLTRDKNVAPILMIQSDDPVFLSEKTWFTSLARNQTKVNIAIMMFLILAISAYLVLLARKGGKDSEN